MPCSPALLRNLFLLVFNIGCLLPAALAQDSIIVLAPAKKTNTIGINYDFTYLDKAGYNPWHLLSLEYSKALKNIPLTARINYANRFNLSDWQIEADAYPVLSKKIYTYLNAGYAGKALLFPKYRAGFSMYVSLPAAWEAEAGARFLYFNSSTFIYTASLGKYYKKYWFNVSSFLTPANGDVTGSYFLKTRYYLNDTDFVMLLLGTGISPDDKNNNVQLASAGRLSSKKAVLSFKRTFKKTNILLFSSGFTKQETIAGQFINQYNFSIGFNKRF